jgi:hypothetical protein
MNATDTSPAEFAAGAMVIGVELLERVAREYLR